MLQCEKERENWPRRTLREWIPSLTNYNVLYKACEPPRNVNPYELLTKKKFYKRSLVVKFKLNNLVTEL